MTRVIRENQDSTDTESSGNPRERKIPNLDASTDSNGPNDSDTESHPPKGHTRHRKYTKQADKKIGRKFPVCEKLRESNESTDEPLLTSTPIGNTAFFQPETQPVHRHTLRQRPLFGETLTSAATGNGTNLNDAVGSGGPTNELGEPNVQ